MPAMLGAQVMLLLLGCMRCCRVVHLARQLAGISVADVDGRGRSRRRCAPGVGCTAPADDCAIVLVTAAGGSFAPVVVPVVVMVLVLVGLSSWLMRSPALVVVLVCCCWSGCDELVVAVAIEPRLAVEHMTGGELAGVSVADAGDAVSFGGEGGLGLLGIALVVPVIAALLITRAWRLTWAVRGASLSVWSVAAPAHRKGVARTSTCLGAVGDAVYATLPQPELLAGFGSDVLDRAWLAAAAR